MKLKVLNVGLSSISGISYPEDELVKAIARYNSRSWRLGCLLKAEFPDNKVNIEDVSHSVDKLYLENGSVYADITILDTPASKLIPSKFGATPIMQGVLNSERVVSELMFDRIDLKPE